MKHKNLLFKTCILLVCFLFTGLVSLNAQTWNAPAYEGSIPVSGTQYYIYNVGSNGFLNRGGNYSTEAVLSASPTVNATATTVKWAATNVSGSTWTFLYNNTAAKYLFASSTDANGWIYTDGGTGEAINWTLALSDALNNIYTFQISSSFVADAGSQYLGTSATTFTATTGICNDVRYRRASGDNYTKWKFVSDASFAKYNAKVLLDRYMTYAKNKGIDITSYLNTYNNGITADISTAATNLLTALGRTTIGFTNNSFESATAASQTTMTGWTNSGSFKTQNSSPALGWTKAGTYFIEKFATSGTNLAVGTITQTVSSLTSGMYELIVSGHAVQQAGANPLHTGAFITAGASSTEVVAGKDYSIENINVSSGSLTVGYSLVAPVACNWTGFDNFRLYYYGAAVSNIYISKSSFDLSATPFQTTFDLGGANLTNDITITPPAHITLSSASPNLVDNGNGTYTLTAANANAATIIVTATWDTSATGSGNIQLSSTGATTKTIAVTASTDPALIVDNSNLAFTPHTNTRAVTVTGANLTDDVTLAFSNGNFSTVRSLTILKADVMALGGVTFNVDCSATAAASGTLTVTANSITRTINLASSASDALTINTRSFFVDQSTVNNLQFTVSQGDLYGISLTAPAGITLTKTSDGSPISSITNANVYSGSFGVTATWDGATRINNGKIRLTTNGLNDSIVVIAIPRNLISSWDGDNNTAATSASYPSAYGWDETTADGVTSANPTWQYYNGSGNIRYVPVTGPGHQYLGKAITLGRSCYFRNWGTSGANKFNLITPTLTAGVTYQFNGIACLNSNASTGTFTLSVNSAKSNVGTSLGSQSVYFASTLSASKYNYQFTPVNTSAYYVVLSTDQSADVILSPDYLSIDSIGDTRPALHTASNITVDVAGATWNTAFAPSTLNYIVHVPVETTSVTPTVTKAFSGETVSGDGTVTLIDGEATSTIVVTSQDANSSTTYNFRYTTKSGDATLSNLVVSSGSLKPAFNPAVTSYTVYLANGTTASSSAATKANASATVSGDGAISLTNGVATSNVLVTAEDGVTVKTYTITYSGLALMHSYTFDDGANDSPANGASAVNGTLYNNTTTATISGGKFTASTTAAGVAADVTNTGDFIALNGAALALNTYPGITVEAYITASNAGNAGFTMFSYFGGATGSNAFYTSLARNDNVSRASYADTYNASGIELEDGALHHVVSILTKDSVYLYTDGYLSAKALNVKPISDLSSTYAYLCKSGWGDPTWVGTIDEFNIYTGRMDAATIKTRALAYVPATVYTGTTENIISVNKSASEIIVQPGAKLTLNSGIQLAANSITLQSDATGTATFVNSGTTAIATANVQQYLSSGRNWYISSPVSGATSAAITGTTANSLVSYNEVDGTWPAAGTTLTAGKGYIAVSPTSSAAVTFTGTLNTGAQSFSLNRTDSLVQKRGFNLVGNPYPSYLNWESATRTNVGPTMWYRSKDGGQYVFATYGAVSKIGTSLGGTPVTNFIPPMQAFWVRVSGAGSGTLAFNNTMRSHSATTNLMKAPSATKATQQVLRLQVSNGTNNDEAIILFNENATNGFDDYDSPKMSNANASIPEIYTMVGSEKLVINGLTSVTPNEELALGFTTGQSNSFSIKATQISNFDAGTRIYLRDNLLNTEQELTNTTDYTFTSDIASTSSRFSVVFKSAGVTTGINSADANITISKNTNNQITVNCKAVNPGATVSVYNALGQQIQTKQITQTRTIFGAEFTSGVYVVTVNNGGKSVTQKVTLN